MSLISQSSREISIRRYTKNTITLKRLFSTLQMKRRNVVYTRLSLMHFKHINALYTQVFSIHAL